MSVAAEAAGAVGAAAGPVLPAPFGWHTRYLLRSYLLHSFLALAAVLVIALSIDLTFFLAGVLAAPPPVEGAAALGRLAWYAAMRSADFAAELLPLGCFLGVLWSEVIHTLSRERLIVWLSGRTPMQCLAPIALFAVLAALLQALLIVQLRPAAVMAQAQAGLGSYGERFSRALSAERTWLAAGEDLIEARIDFSAASLRDLRLYRMSASHRLAKVLQADSAAPSAPGGWFLKNVRGVRIAAAASGPASEFVATEMRVDLALDPLWLANWGINVRYLPAAVFEALGRVKFSPDSEYRTWRQARWAMSLFTGAMALLAGSLSLWLLAYRVRLTTLFLLGLAGYGAHVMMKLFIVLGEQGYAPPTVAAWTAPLLLTLLGPLLLWKGRSARRSRN